MNTQWIHAPAPEPQHHPATAAQAPIPTPYLRFGAFCLDLQRERLSKDGARVKLPGKVYQALVVLIAQPGQIVTREALRMRLWSAGTYVNYDANVKTTVNKLRQILGDSAEQPNFVDTIPRRGYSFIAKVAYLDQSPLPTAVCDKKSEAIPAEENSAKGGVSFLRKPIGSTWFMALLIAGMLLGAGLVLYTHR